jgi:threonine/homoserine/homoserine lactone efflux protein
MGLATGLGAATADAAYGCIAGFGLTVASNFLVGHRLWLGLWGGLFLCYLGIRTFVSKPAERGARVSGGGLFAAYLSALLLTLSNPMTILSFVAVFAGLGLGTTPNYLSAIGLVGGVFVGSALWWLLLSYGVSLFQSRMSSAWMRTVNRFSGGIIFGFGLYAISMQFRR